MNRRPISHFQTDPRWAALPYRVPGERSTIGGSGCGPTAAAMLIETLTQKDLHAGGRLRLVGGAWV